MKTNSIILFLSFSLIFLQCKKMRKDYTGEYTATFNIQSWKSDPSINKTNDFSIYATQVIKRKNVNFLAIANLKKSIEKQIIHPYIQIKDRIYAEFKTIDIDAGCEMFEVDTTDTFEDYFLITKQADGFAEVWGEFQLSLHRIKDCGNPLILPEKVKFENGKFHLYLNR